MTGEQIPAQQVQGSAEEGSLVADAGETTELSTDTVFHLLQNDRRRAALRYLRAADGPVDVGDLAEAIAAAEQDTTVTGLSAQQRQRVYISLYQTHLPKLDDCGVVEYRKNRGVVRRRPAADQLDRYLFQSPDGPGTESARSRWPTRYGAAVVVGSGVVGASVLEIGSLSGTVAAIVVLALVAVVAGWHVVATAEW